MKGSTDCGNELHAFLRIKLWVFLGTTRDATAGP